MRVGRAFITRFRFSWPAEVGAVGSWIFEKRKFFDGHVEMSWEQVGGCGILIGRAQQKLEQFEGNFSANFTK